jgi:hypothetical protein
VGEAASAKSGVAGWVTVRLIGVDRVSPPPVPVTVTVAAPSVAVLDADRVRTLLLPVTGLTLKLAVTPAGNPLALNETELVKPPVRVIVIVLVPLAPRLTVRLAGLAESAKSGVGGPGSLPNTLVAPSKTEMLGALMGVAPGVVAIPVNEKSLVGSHAPELAIRN